MHRRRIAPGCVAAIAGVWCAALPLSVSFAADNTPATSANPSATPVEVTPRVLFAGAPLPASAPARAPFRDPTDGILCVAPESLAPLGLTYILDDKAGKATFAGPDGTTTVTVALRTPSKESNRSGDFVPVNDVVEGLGGKCEWYAGTNTLQLRAVLTSIEMLGGQLRIKATFPIMPAITDANGGRQIIIDVSGAERGAIPRTVDLQSPLVDQTRVGQFQDDTARIVLEMKQPYAFSVLGGKPTPQVVLNPAIPAAPPPAIVVATPTPNPTASAKLVHGKVPPSPPICLVRGVTFHKISDQVAQFIISTDRVPSLRAALSKGRLTLDLLNSTLANKADALDTFDHPFLRAVRLLANGSSAAQLVLDLTRAVVYTVRPSDKGSVELDLSLPRGAVGKLAGKTIVVDPGHGGHDSGAPGVNGTAEKNVNLAIAMQLTETLRAAGANVIMTRSTDYFIPVDDRPIIANRAAADFFISVHSDSADYNHSVTGSTVYFHFNQPSCRALAQCIADHLADIGDIRSKGIGSDGIRFPGVGYGVLRGSQMVAVLVECGYMTNRNDVRKLNDPATQKKTAEAIVDGLRDYIEGNPHQDTRDVNPQPDNGTELPPPVLDNDATSPFAAPAQPDDTSATGPNVTSASGPITTGDGGSVVSGAPATPAPANNPGSPK